LNEYNPVLTSGKVFWQANSWALTAFLANFNELHGVALLIAIRSLPCQSQPHTDTCKIHIALKQDPGQTKVGYWTRCHDCPHRDAVWLQPVVTNLRCTFN